eukprot:TRINITY_DN10679_c0_g1_i1.p1 TRINITY_DN10679_c0_g1~~TRINITY_DN10679_c0_g1_i1.p1  ORF type:complete len:147 (+),score=19.89 TRINITY_DN10679_c0_g1_i1:97-537(+)
MSTVTEASSGDATLSAAKEHSLNRGLVELLLPVLNELDTQVQEVYRSQETFALQIKALTDELERYSKIAQSPSVSPYVEKLNRTQGRIDHINAMLQVITSRLDRMESRHLPSAANDLRARQAAGNGSPATIRRLFNPIGQLFGGGD